MIWSRAVSAAVWAGAAALAASVGIYLLSRAELVTRPSVVFSLVIVTAAAAVAAATFRRTPSLVDAARALERLLPLEERLSTSLAVEGRADPLAVALRHDAAELAGSVSLRGLLRPRVNRAQFVTLAVVALLAGGAVLWPTLTGAPQLATGSGDGAVEPSGHAADYALILPRAGADATADGAPAAAAVREARRPEAPLREATPSGTGAASAPRGTAGTTADARAVAAAREVDSPLLGEVADAAASQGRRDGAAPNRPSGDTPPPSARNDGGTNPRYDQAAGRDQELRELARRREAAGDSGGGSGEPIAMVDASVAGDATAADGDGSGTPLPLPGQGRDEVSVPTITDPSGRRVRLERLPEDVDLSGLYAADGQLEFRTAQEPTVSRERVSVDESDLLRSYREALQAAGGGR